MRAYRSPHAPYLPIAYMDDEVLVIDKPSGLLSVPGKTPDLDDCVEARAKAWLRSAHIVHRLDMDTSGLIILARSRLGSGICQSSSNSAKLQRPTWRSSGVGLTLTKGALICR